MEEGGKAKEQGREEQTERLGHRRWPWWCRRSSWYLTRAICEDTRIRKHTWSLARARQGILPHVWAPSPGWHSCLQVLLRTVFMSWVKAQWLGVASKLSSRGSGEGSRQGWVGLKSHTHPAESRDSRMMTKDPKDKRTRMSLQSLKSHWSCITSSANSFQPVGHLISAFPRPPTQPQLFLFHPNWPCITTLNLSPVKKTLFVLV